MSEQTYDGPPPRGLLKFITRLNVFVYKLSNGRLMNTLSGMPIVLIEMTGAKTGKQRTIPLMYVPHEKGLLLVASQGGAPKHPVWYYNLKAHPDVKVTFDGSTKSMKARELSVEEKAEVWATCCQYYPPYQDYQDYTDREIPIFLCE